MGLQRRMIVEFSFLLAVPTMLAATGMELVKNIHAFSADQMAALAIGFIVSFFLFLYSERINSGLFHVNFSKFRFCGVDRFYLLSQKAPIKNVKRRNERYGRSKRLDSKETPGGPDFVFQFA